MITDFRAKYFDCDVTKRCSSDSFEKLTAVLADVQVDLNPHQVTTQRRSPGPHRE